VSLHLDIQSACSDPAPDEGDLRDWIAAALDSQAPRGETEICVRLVGEVEMSVLNETYRGKAGPTNVLSFPCDLPRELGLPLLGDIVICAPVVIAEATGQGKNLSAHWAHMAIHGTLHLLGYDHIEEEEAALMEALESNILQHLDYPCPFRGEPSQACVTK